MGEGVEEDGEVEEEGWVLLWVGRWVGWGLVGGWVGGWVGGMVYLAGQGG